MLMSTLLKIDSSAPGPEPLTRGAEWVQEMGFSTPVIGTPAGKPRSILWKRAVRMAEAEISLGEGLPGQRAVRESMEGNGTRFRDSGLQEPVLQGMAA